MSGTILLADDSLTIQKVIELTFAETGFDVIAVSSGEELMQKLPECRPDVIICDVIMPGRDGYDVCQAIKSDPGSLHIPVILLTGTFEPFDKDRALAAGCSEIITKPFEARKLVDAVEKLVQGNAESSFDQPQSADDGRVQPPTFEGQVTPPPPQYDGQVTPPPPQYDGQVTPPPPQFESQVEPPPQYENQVEPPQFGSQVEPPPVPSTPMQSEAGEGNFETRFIEPAAPEAVPEDTAESDEALDFTSTGFSEMEAAGQRDRDALAATPEHGLEYEFDTSPAEEPPAGSVDTGPVEPYQPSEPAEFAAPDTDADADEAVYEFGDSPAPSASPASGIDEPETTDEEPLWGGAPAEAPPSYDDERETGPVDVNTLAPTADTDSLVSDAVRDYTDTVHTEPEPMPEQAPPMETADGDSTEESDTSSFGSEPTPDQVETPEAVFEIAADPVESTPFEEEEEEEEEEAVPEEPIAETTVELEDTDPEDLSGEFNGEPAPQPLTTSDVMPDEMPDTQLAVEAKTPTLSDDDIDRIARRVLELAAEKIELIAWEVIPDMAEIVVRERIRELEATVEDAEND